MSSGFRDTFTKDEQKEGLLGYDDTAFYYFAGVMLLLVAVPLTWSTVSNLVFGKRSDSDVETGYATKNKSGSTYRYCQASAMVRKREMAKKGRRTCTCNSTFWFFMKVGFIALLWGCFHAIVQEVGHEKEINAFNPFAILEVSTDASAQEIKKAYRRLSLVYHPDKNPDNPLAQSKFIQITKAHQALTDEVAKENYEKYGNPDGPQTTKVGIGLPRFLLEKENHLLILLLFFFFLLFVVPVTFICYYNQNKNYAGDGVLVETWQYLANQLRDATRVKHCPELLAATAESRALMVRPTDNVDMKPILEHAIEHKKRTINYPVIVRNQYLIWAHMQRLHHHMSPELRQDCDTLLKHSMKITQAMIDLACSRGYFITAQSIIEFRRCLVQALDVKCSQLLQVPYFNEDLIKVCSRGRHPFTSLTDFIAKDPGQRERITKLEPNQLADVEAFCQHVSDVEIRARIEVEDEEEIVLGDVATCTVEFLRRNLKPGEAVGPVHAPFFPEPKFEEWWLFLLDSSTTMRLITLERLRNTDRFVEEKLRFQVVHAGKQNLVLYALCDSYAGIDHKIDLPIHVKHEHEVKRSVFTHPQDEELDRVPTLFQQFMGNTGPDEESEEEEEAKCVNKDKGKTKKAAPKKDEASSHSEDSQSSDSSSSDSD